MANGLVELNLFGRGEYEYVATIRDIVLSDIPEAVALLALDLAELYNLGVRQRASSNKAFQRAVLQLAAQLRKDAGLSSSAQLEELAHAETLRRERCTRNSMGSPRHNVMAYLADLRSCLTATIAQASQHPRRGIVAYGQFARIAQRGGRRRPAQRQRDPRAVLTGREQSPASARPGTSARSAPRTVSPSIPGSSSTMAEIDRLQHPAAQDRDHALPGERLLADVVPHKSAARQRLADWSAH
jgi:hypothetical protein